MLNALRQRNFALLWLGQLISLAGDWALLVALPFAIYDLTDSALATGGMFLAQMVPRVFLGSVAGVFVDRWDRKRTMIAADLARAAILLPLLFVRSADWVWVIYLCAFVQATLAQFFNPAKNALIPLLVPTGDLAGANGLNALSENATRLAAPAIGGVLYGLFGLRLVVAADSVSYVASALLIVGIVHAARTTGTSATPEHLPPQSPSSVGKGERAARPVWRAWRDGLRFMHADRTIRAIFIIMGISNIAEGIFPVMIVPFVKDVLHRGAEGLGLIVSVQAVGGIIGSLLLSSVNRRFRPGVLIPLCGILFGLGDIAVVTAPLYAPANAFALSLIFMALVGLPIIGFSVNLRTLLQVTGEDAYRGRIFGAFSALSALAMVVGQALASLLGDRVGTVPMLIVSGGINLVAGVVAFVLLAGQQSAVGRPQIAGEPIASQK